MSRVMRAFTSRYCILFRNVKAKSEGISFDVCEKLQNKLVTIATSLGLPRNLCQFYNPYKCVYQMLKWWWSSVQYLLRYLVRYVDFCRLVRKVTETPCVISGVSGPIAIKLTQNVGKILPLNTCKSELRYSKRQQVEWRSFHKFCTKSVVMATSLEVWEEEVWINKIHANAFHLVKGSYKSVQ